MRAIAQTFMIIFAVIEACCGLKRTVTTEDHNGNKTYVPL